MSIEQLPGPARVGIGFVASYGYYIFGEVCLTQWYLHSDGRWHTSMATDGNGEKLAYLSHYHEADVLLRVYMAKYEGVIERKDCCEGNRACHAVPARKAELVIKEESIWEDT